MQESKKDVTKIVSFVKKKKKKKNAKFAKCIQPLAIRVSGKDTQYWD